MDKADWYTVETVAYRQQHKGPKPSIGATKTHHDTPVHWVNQNTS